MDAVESFSLRNVYKWADPRMRDKVFMGSALPIVTWIAFYLVLVKFLKQWMEERKAYDVRKFSIALYSFYAVTYAYLFLKVAPFWLTNYNWRCEPLDTSSSSDALQVSKSSRWLTEKLMNRCIRWWT
jgi:GNS1/SUR4 family